MKKIIYFIMFIMILSIVNAGKVDYVRYFDDCTGSMLPTISCKDKLIINTVDEPIINNIYCYRPDYRNFNLASMWLVCHRLVDIQEDLYIFKGDNNKYNDEPIERKYIAWEIINY